MSFDIDMKTFAGAPSDPVAVDQPIVDTNSYQQELKTEEFPVQTEFLDQPVIKQEVDEIPSKQELNFRALREEVDRIKAEKKELEYNMDLMRANMAQRPQESSIKPKKMFDGMNDDDIPNVSEIRKEWDQKESQYQSRIEELQVAQQYSDYAEVIEKYALPLVKQKPHLAEGMCSHKAFHFPVLAYQAFCYKILLELHAGNNFHSLYFTCNH